VALGLALAGCGLGDDLFHPASLPVVVDHGGELLHTVDLVTITYPNDGDAAGAIGFDDYAPRSRWLVAVGAEYGVRGGVHAAQVVVPHDAPAHMSEDDLRADLAAARAAAPPPDGKRYLYMLWLPHGTRLEGVIGTSCVDYAGYHDALPDGSPFAVIAACFADRDDRTVTASHEIIEAATDPHLDGLYVDAPGRDPWHFWNAPEVADMCQYFIPPVREGDFAFQRSWSQEAARASRPIPCVPAPAGEVWIDVDVDPRAVIDAAPGERVDVALTGWASGPTDDWKVNVVVDFQSQFTPHTTLTDRAMNDGRAQTLSITVPSGARAGTYAQVQIWSRGAVALVEVHVPTSTSATSSDAERRPAATPTRARRATKPSWR
jgi:hypothetical protein